MAHVLDNSHLILTNIIDSQNTALKVLRNDSITFANGRRMMVVMDKNAPMQ